MRLKLRFPSRPQVQPGLRARLMLSFLVVVLPAFLLLVVSDYRHYSNRRDASLAQGRATAEAASALLQADLDQAAAAARLIFASADPGAEAGAQLQGFLAGRPQYLDAFLLDAHGELLAIAPPGRPLAVDPAVLEWANGSPGPVVSDLLQSPPDNQPAVQVLVPGGAPGGPAGVLGVTVDAAALGRQLERLAQDTPFSITLCDRRGWSICSTDHPDPPWEDRHWGAYDDVLRSLQEPATLAQNVSCYLDGRPYVGAALQVPGTGWVVSVYEPAPGLLTYLGSRTLAGLLLFLSLALLSLLVAAALGRWFTAPLARLAQHARALGRGQLNERIAMRAGDEFGDLASALNSMAGQMEERDRRLRARTAELEAIITQSADGIAIHGPEGELQRLNPAGIRILGRSPGRLGLSLAEQASWFHIHTPSGSGVDPNDLPVVAALRGETRLAQELCVETEEGQERYLAVSASPLSDTRGRIYGAVTIFRDMTQAHRAQQEKDDFISLVSHELKTPITSIKGYAQMLLRRAEEAGGDERDLKGLRIINDEVERMVDLINQLLDVSRLETQRLQLNRDLVDLVALTSDAVDRLQMTTTRHTLRLRAPQQPVWVDGDALRLAQVLGNLIMNAIKYSPAGGPVEITVESQEERGWVSVRDWGLGISPEDQPHIFQRFYRGTRKGFGSLTGMGLGLYISREIVQRHHGDIVFHSQVGQGTTFLFWLPLAKVGESGRRMGGQTHPSAREGQGSPALGDARAAPVDRAPGGGSLTTS